MSKFMNKLMKLNMSPMPTNIYYWWNFGSLLGMCLILQIISGLFLTMFFENNMETTFNSINQIERNVNMGWILRSLHANGASMFFVFIYLHIGRGLYFKSFYSKYVWLSGVTILLLLFMTAFIGYVLPWGQMSFWGATVITNLVSSMPYIGKMVTMWIWGNFSVNKSTLMRFFTLHFILPFLMMIMIIIHILILHNQKSSNPLMMNSNMDKIPFQPYFTWKDLLGVIFSMTIFIPLTMIFPYSLMDPDNFTPANPLVTPPHIQPEWYFLFAYAILRTIPNKLGGVMALMMSIMVLMALPFMAFYMNNNKFTFSEKSIKKILMSLWFFNFIFLTMMGAMPIEEPYETLSKFSSLTYFALYVTFM